jgi:hypothetical protein
MVKMIYESITTFQNENCFKTCQFSSPENDNRRFIYETCHGVSLLRNEIVSGQHYMYFLNHKKNLEGSKAVLSRWSELQIWMILFENSLFLLSKCTKYRDISRILQDIKDEI